MDNITTKNYIGISRDHSGSMSCLATPAQRDYNETIQLLKDSAVDLEIFLSVVNCGDGRNARVSTELHNIPIANAPQMSSYSTSAPGTPLFDSVGTLIELFENCPDANNPNASFLVMAVTDGEENSSRKWSGYQLTNKIKQLQATDRWTFVFRVPKGYKRKLLGVGIPEGNIFEWDQTAKGVQEGTEATASAFTEYYTGLRSGVKSTSSFYTNLSNIDLKDIKKSLVDISKEIQIWHVDTEAEGKNIREYCKFKLGSDWKKGAAFYLLMKPEREVQDYKQIIIKSKTSGEFFSGSNARIMLGLPTYGTHRVAPGDHGDYEIFLQSTSVNRKLPVGTTLAYWNDFDKS
jgi:hypothetical protein